MLRLLFFIVFELVRCLAAAQEIAPTAIAMQHSTFGGITNITQMHFTHVMKCGGSTLDAMLRVWNYNRKSNFTTAESYKQPRPTALSSSKFWLIVIRNPLDRVISHYWQVKPWERHPKGGAHTGCKNAAVRGFTTYLKSCFYARNFMSLYFQPSPDMGGYLHQLNNYNLVIPFEYLQKGVLLLHLYNGFTVEDVLYLNQKIYHNPKLTMTEEEKSLVEKSNNQDAMLYKAAQTAWSQRFEALVSTPAFEAQHTAFKQLLRIYQQDAEPYSICFACGPELHNCSYFNHRRLDATARKQYVSHYQPLYDGQNTDTPSSATALKKQHASQKTEVARKGAVTRPLPIAASRIVPRKRGPARRSQPIPLEQQCQYISMKNMAIHKRDFCVKNKKCSENNLLA